MDEGPEHQLGKPGLFSEPTQCVYPVDQSRKGLTSGLYLDENLEKGLGMDTSSIFYYALNGGPYSSAYGKGVDGSRYGSSNKMVSQHSAADIFSATGPLNVSKDHCWDQIDFSKKAPDPIYQFYEESGSGNSNMFSQSSGYNNQTFGVSESFSQILDHQTDQHGPLINCENYMNSCVREMLVDKASRLNSSSYGLQSIGEPNYVGTSVENSKSLHGRGSEVYFARPLDLKPPSVSFSPLAENKKADDSSLQAAQSYKPTNPSYLQDVRGNYVASPVDTGESYFNSLGRSCTTLSGVENAKSGDPSLQGVRVNKSVDSSDLQVVGKSSNNVAGSLGTVEYYQHKNDGYFGPSPDVKPPRLSSTSISMQSSEDVEVCPNEVKDVAEGNDVESPVDTGESYYLGGEGCTGRSHGVDPQRLSASMSMEFTAASPMDEDTDDNDQTVQGVLISERTEGRKSKVCYRQKKAQKSNDSRYRRKWKEESTYSSRNNQSDDSESKPQRKASKQISMSAGKQDPYSDEEYEPSRSDFKLRRSLKASDRRKNNKLWTLSEVTKLVDGISQFGVGKWTSIRKNYFGSSPHRSPLDIRDKWRNLLRTSVVQAKENQKNGTVILPRSLLERIRELDNIHPYYKKM